MGFMLYLFIGLFILVCLILILLILIQKGRGGGLASAFGGAGGNTAFGSKTGDVLTWATSIIFGIFLLLAIVLNFITNAQYGGGGNTPAAPGSPGSPQGNQLPQPLTPDPGAFPPAANP